MKLRIEKLIYGGAGLAHHEGKAVFVPFTLPGELAEARITKDRGSYAEAEFITILEPSAERTQPACPHFGSCGGCHYQHAAYAQQVTAKTQILRESLERARIAEIPELAPLTGEPLSYRNRIRLHVDRATSQIGYKRRSSHQILTVSECPIAAPALQQALAAIQADAKAWRLGEHFTEIELFTNAAQDAILLTLWTSGAARTAMRQLETLWPQLRAAIPALTGAAVFSAKEDRMLAQHGESSLIYTADGRDYRVSIGSFFQVNRFLIDPLVSAAISAASGHTAWDLYAGVGLFAATLASRFEQVTAVESAPSSVSDLRQNLHGKPHRIVASTTLDFLRHAHARKESAPDFVVVDPPRAGLGDKVTALLAALRPPHITYVSCDPATLSRDLKSLLDSGYHLGSLRMVDLFPQTFHLESVATLSLK